MDSQCGIDAMWRDRCDACSSREERVGSRGAGDCSAARRSANRSIARARIRTATPKSERPSGRRRSRTGGRLRVSPLTQCRATLNLCLHFNYPAANFVPNPSSPKSVPQLDREACASSRQLSARASSCLTRATIRLHNSTILSSEPRCSAVSSSNWRSCASARSAASGLFIPCCNESATCPAA